MKVAWTQQAKRDIKAIHDYIAPDSFHYAGVVVDAILQTEHQIGAFPTAGGIVREKMRKDIRQVKRYSYRIIYRIYRRRIDVLTVVHERRSLELGD